LFTGKREFRRSINWPASLSEHKESSMKKIIAVTILTAVASLGFVASQARAAAPCEEMLKDMRAAKATAKLSDADMAKVNDLEAKAIERCNADDDTRSDKFLADAMKILGK
jgi:hypothetical protein